MRILFDQGVPVPLRRSLPGHSIVTVFEKNWNTMENGELLFMAEREGLDVFITTDQNLKYQQNLKERQIAIVVLTTTSWARIRRQTDIVLETINAVRPGEYHEVTL